MSRLIIKNLPKKISEEKLREVFGAVGTLTDVQLKYTKEGKFRQFAFIGYQKEDEAEKAIKEFNNMCIKTSVITVGLCAALGDATKPKSWSKHSTDNKAVTALEPPDKPLKRKAKTKDESAELLSKYQDDLVFKEFLDLHAPGESKKLQNLPKEAPIEVEEVEDKPQKIADEQITDLDYMKKLVTKKKKEPRSFELFTLKLKGLPYTCKKKDIKDFLKPVTPFSIRKPRQIHGIAYVGFKTQKLLKKALLKDRSFLCGKQIFVSEYTKKEENETSNAFKSEETLKNEESIAESGKIFIRNLSYTVTEEELEKLLSPYGPIAELKLPIDATTKKIKAFATVTYMLPEHAVKVFSELDGSLFHGRMLHILPGKTQESTASESEEAMSFKQKKLAKEKSRAGSSHNWNSLFLGHDAVAEVIADTYQTSKQTVLGDGSAAVRLALGETQIVAQTRKFLEEQGVILDVFASPQLKKSKVIVIVKNLPSKTDAGEIRNVFKKFGTLGRVILPPSGITALVEFFEPSEARKAFTSLAYTKFKNAPLYLEWAPENSLKEKAESAPKPVEIEETVPEEPTVEEIEPEDDTTIFVKNLNFQTTDRDLEQHFNTCGALSYASVATKRDKEDPKLRLSMGYGFVRFIYKADADKALKTLQQSQLDGKSLELKRSERVLSNEVKTTKKVQKLGKQTGSKILVRNVPFQATIQEIRELFSAFGEIKALRLPKKMNLDSGSHRGFAFVDFVSNSDAKKAFEALSQSTHLYGRRLVLEWAATEEGVDEIRKRTAEQFKPKEPIKRSKKSVLSIE